MCHPKHVLFSLKNERQSNNNNSKSNNDFSGVKDPAKSLNEKPSPLMKINSAPFGSKQTTVIKSKG